MIKLWTPDDVAEALRCSRTTVYRMVEEGKLPSVRVGRLLRFDPNAVQAALRGSSCGQEDDHVRPKSKR
jgi:excisionase family DNA binding protein